MKNSGKIHRIVVGATCYADARSVIEISAFLAESIKGELQAVLIEEEAVFSLSARPAARVTLSGGMSRPVTAQAMMDAFQRDAAAFEKAVRETAAKRAVDWSFETRRGEFPVALNHNLTTGDLIVFGYQVPGRLPGEFLVVDYTNDLDVSLIELAANVAHEMKRPLHVVLLRKSPDHAIKVSDHARSRMEQLAVNLTILDQDNSQSALLDAVRHARVATVMVSAELVRDVGLARLLENARCPVIVFTG